MADTANGSRTPPKRPRSPSPERSPPRKRKRPGASARIAHADIQAARKAQERRQKELEQQARAEGEARGVQDVVRQHYNSVEQRGREWRKTDSKIKGLRSFNNWVKSAIIQSFSPSESYTPGDAPAVRRNLEYEVGGAEGLKVLDIGCGKGGDLQKWQQAPQRVDLYVGVDPADVSIDQARERYTQMARGPRGSFKGRPRSLFHAEFIVKDCFRGWIGDIQIIREVGIDPNVGPGEGAGRWGGGGFDVVSMMFCMHYAFETEEMARDMLRNVAGSLKKGGRFLGVIPNSDVLSAKVREYHQRFGTDDGAQADDEEDNWDPEKSLDNEPEAKAGDATKENGEKSKDHGIGWGNSIYRVKFPGATPKDGVFRPPFGWKYFYFLEEAVEEIPEYVVPWEAFRALAEDYNLELQYRKPFKEVWEEENGDPILGPLSERMNVRGRGRGPLLVTEEEMDAASFYHAFCFYKV